MEKRNLIEIINDVATSLDYEVVSSIGDTPESDQISRIIRNEYSKLMDRLDWPHLKVRAQLIGLGDVTQPATMRIPDAMTSVEDVRYNVTEATDTDEIIDCLKFIPDTREFLDLIYSRSTSNATSITTYNTPEGVPIWTYTDRPPEFYTTFDDNLLVFDAFDSAEDNTLQTSKSSCTALRGPTWIENDTFVPPMPISMFSMFVSKCKVIANEQLRQVTLATEARDHQISQNRLSRQNRVQEGSRKPNYGRARSTSRTNYRGR